MTNDGWRGCTDDDQGLAGSYSHSGIRLSASTRALLGGLLRPYRQQALRTLVMLVVATATALAGPYLVAIGIDRGLPALSDAHDPSVLVWIGLSWTLTIVLSFIAKRSLLRLAATISQGALLDLRLRLYQQAQRLSLGFHERFGSGRIVARLTSDLDAIAELADQVAELVMATVWALSLVAVVLVLDVQLGWILLAALPFLAWGTHRFQVGLTRAISWTGATFGLAAVYFLESMNGIAAVQAFRRESRNREIFTDLDEDYRRSWETASRLPARYTPAIKAVGNIVLAVTLAWGGWQVGEGELGLGTLVAILLYLRRFFDDVQDIGQAYGSLYSAAIALNRASGFLSEQPDVIEPTRPTRLAPSRWAAGDITLSDVTFAYDHGGTILQPTNLTIPSGQTVALVGATGAGKSTLARLVARLYDPTSGRVRIDGVDLRDIADRELRTHMIMVSQENFLFTGTVADNIAIGRPDASRADIEDAAEAIGADAFIQSLPDGYDTEVQHRGARLSAGQRQLVAFARAFLADPAVLILDEATSFLDAPTERQVQRALRTVLTGRTALVIAHRLSTVAIANRVLVMEAGRIIEDGPPADLVATGGRYATLHQQWRDSLG